MSILFDSFYFYLKSSIKKGELGRLSETSFKKVTDILQENENESGPLW